MLLWRTCAHFTSPQPQPLRGSELLAMGKTHCSVCQGGGQEKNLWVKLPKKRNVRVYQPFTHPFPRMAQACLFPVSVQLRYVRVNGAPSCMMPCGSRWKDSIWKGNDTTLIERIQNRESDPLPPQALAAHVFSIWHSLSFSPSLAGYVHHCPLPAAAPPFLSLHLCWP